MSPPPLPTIRSSACAMTSFAPSRLASSTANDIARAEPSEPSSASTIVLNILASISVVNAMPSYHRIASSTRPPEAAGVAAGLALRRPPTMLRVKRLLVGFDGSAESRDALRLGDELAELEGAELIVAAVFPFAPLPIEASALEEEAAEYFADRFAEVERELDHDFERRELGWESPARALNGLAEEERADVIVIGSTHRGTVGRVYPGGV